jgi:hypothetical protein
MRHFVTSLLLCSVLAPAVAGADDGFEAAVSLLEQSLKDGSLARLTPASGKRFTLGRGFAELGGPTKTEIPIMEQVPGDRGRFQRVGTREVLARGRRIATSGQRQWHTSRAADLEVVNSRLGGLGLRLRVVDHYQKYTPFAEGDVVTGIESQRKRTLWLPVTRARRLTGLARRRLQQYLPTLSAASIQAALQTGRDGEQGLVTLDREVGRRAARRALEGREVTLASTAGTPRRRVLGDLLGLRWRREDHRLALEVVEGKPRYVLSTRVTLSNFEDTRNPVGLRTRSYNKPEQVIPREQLPRVLARHDLRLSPGQVQATIRGARVERARRRRPGLLRRR